MEIDFDIDYLIFSSHKTATQTLVKTFHNAGLRSLHLHQLPDVGLRTGELEKYLKGYCHKKKKKLTVISVFREPVERHISSFFHGYGTRPVRLSQVKDEFETIIYRYPMKKLHEKFIAELNDFSIIGFNESIYEICKELKITVHALNYDKDRNYGIFENELIKLFIFRFDILTQMFDSILEEAIHRKLHITNANMGCMKWYKNIYSEFKSSLTIPPSTISNVYEYKRDLIDLFYSNNYNLLLSETTNKYSCL